MSCENPLLPTYFVMFIITLFCQTVTAQHSHGVLSPSVTFPQDDSVLRVAPRTITMSFRVDVRILKLALYTDTGDWIDLGFRYEPQRINHNFVYPLPEQLPTARYYVARWSVVDDRNRPLNGEFKFSFGPGALPPSEIIAAGYSDPSREKLPDSGSYVGNGNARP